MLEISQEGRSSKFKAQVAGKTFAASSAKGREILYVTERAVFRLQEGEGLELIEIAPGIDLERDILARMPFRPLMAQREADACASASGPEQMHGMLGCGSANDGARSLHEYHGVLFKPVT